MNLAILQEILNITQPLIKEVLIYGVMIIIFALSLFHSIYNHSGYTYLFNINLKENTFFILEMIKLFIISVALYAIFGNNIITILGLIIIVFVILKDYIRYYSFILKEGTSFVNIHKFSNNAQDKKMFDLYP